MEVVEVLHMNSGDGDTSYAHNSLLQRKVLSMTKHVRDEAIQRVENLFPAATSLAIADLGCSSGPNTLLAIKDLITSIYNSRRKSGNGMFADVQVFLNDLPGNDFNTTFKYLPGFQKELRNEMGKCLVHATPGSFYARLFQTQSLHFIHSSYSLHFLSQVPKGIGRSNKSNIYLGSSSPPSVVKAYYEQFQSDFATFLKHRSEELVIGGCMVFTLLGRKSDDPTSKEGGYVWELLSMVLHQMVFEGSIEEEKLDLFNIPKYTPSPAEIESVVKKQGSFAINCLQVSEVDWEAATDELGGDGKERQNGFLGCMRAVSEPMLANHFGEELMDQVYIRYNQILVDRMEKERNFLVNLTVSLTKTI